MGAFTDMLLPDRGVGEEKEKVDKNDEGDPLPGTARHREFYPEGVAKILQVCSACMSYVLIFSRLKFSCS
jgi:endoribonuclease Dicer